ncbi:uncharacterized protein BX664DRAFT_374784 [Halteromyces radiatus]|uniref:uncharacterized protein n=1 Tax=Halteromyces radiatus TaxID=101107 RepID=UPI00221FFB45|nr:uncharacterized protein BX664DRAFT_374784 [Halteromyces radiatus]KAI8086781.1 hypothetical protein BX664DRAFT_374784 [Halteromyces radiatus]
MTKHLNEQQLDESERIGLTYGARGAAIGFGLGAIATMIALKRSPNFQALSTPLKSSMMVAGAASGFLFGADRAITSYENRELGYMDEEMYLNLQKARFDKQPVGSFDRALIYLNENRWSVIGCTWALSMVAALGFSFSNRYLSTQQKLVQARMYAQAATIGVLMASAGLSIYLGEDEEERRKQRNAPDAQLLAVLQLPDDRVNEHKAVH